MDESLVGGSTHDQDYTPSTVSEDSGYSFPEEATVASSTEASAMTSTSHEGGTNVIRTSRINFV